MECVQVTAKIKAEEKIEVGGIGDKHEQDDWGREAPPIHPDAQARFTSEVKERPKTGETVSNGRSHRGLKGRDEFSQMTRERGCGEMTIDIYNIYHRPASYFVSSSCA